MANNTLRCCIVGARDKDLFVLSELHKREGVEIEFVFDNDPTAVGVEIAEILGIPRVTRVEDLPDVGAIDYMIVPSDRGRLSDVIEILAATGIKPMSQQEAVRLAGMPILEVDDADDETPPYGIDDALAAFERLFDREALLRFLLDVAVDATGAAAGSIMMYSPATEELFIGHATGLSERVVRQTRQRIGEGIAGRVAATRKPRLIDEELDTSQPDGRLYAGDRDRVDIGSAICAPLVVDDELLGVVNVSSPHSEEPLDEEDLSTLVKLSGRIAKLLKQAQEFQAARLQQTDWAVRRTVGELSEQHISASEKFATLAGVLRSNLGADAVEVYLSTAEGDWLVMGGSTRRYSDGQETVRMEGGALARCYLEQRTVTLSESTDDDDPRVSSVVYVPLTLHKPLGVLSMEFADRGQLETFLSVKESIALELSRFVGSEKKEHALRRELQALAKLSDAAPTLLTCRSLDDLAGYASRFVASMLQCSRVSVRLGEGDDMVASFYDDTAQRSSTWLDEDAERFAKLIERGRPFHLALMDYGAETSDRPRPYHSLVAVPVLSDTGVQGGVIAYDKHAEDVLDSATFNDVDRHVAAQIADALAPIVARLRSDEPAAAVAPDYDSILEGNTDRLLKVVEGEMARSDRYHQAFSVLLLNIPRLSDMFTDNEDLALRLVDEVSQGVQTRTRKTDYGAWIDRDTLAMVVLEGDRRIRFLVSRLVQYLVRDLQGAGQATFAPADINVGFAVYPGAGKKPQAVVEVARQDLSPFEG